MMFSRRCPALGFPPIGTKSCSPVFFWQEPKGNSPNLTPLARSGRGVGGEGLNLTPLARSGRQGGFIKNLGQRIR